MPLMFTQGKIKINNIRKKAKYIQIIDILGICDQNNNKYNYNIIINFLTLDVFSI